MFIITNRNLLPEATGLWKFGNRLSEAGCNEIRVAEAQYIRGEWELKIFDDEWGPKYRQTTHPECEFASEYVARRVLQDAQTGKKNIVFMIHGFNNNLEAALNRAHSIEVRYGVTVVIFSWPANGGGRGLASYHSDKRDARASAGALERTIEKAHDYFVKFNKQESERIKAVAADRYPEQSEARIQQVVQLLRQHCQIKITLLCHSMGNYLYKQVLKSTASAGNPLLFDNVLLVAADANNDRHSEWVDLIRFRNRLYITINEDDEALALSRMKHGDLQLARLGQFTRKLDSQNARYIDFTGHTSRLASHCYFDDADEYVKSKLFFGRALNGEVAEDVMRYDPSSNLYRL